MESQSGYVSLGGERKAATLSLVHERLQLEVTDIEGHPAFGPSEDIELLTFSGSRNGFTLLGLQHKSSHARLGVGRVTTYSVQLALEDVIYSSAEEISGTTWLLYIEDLAKILHVTGFQQSVAIPEDGTMAITWFFRSAPPVTLNCPKAGLEVHLGQDMKTGGDPISGPSIAFRYSARVNLGEEVALDAALTVLHRIRLFFSLMMGRVLAIEEVALRLSDDQGTHDAKIHGLIPTRRTGRPDRRLLDFGGPEELAAMLDEWLHRFPEISEAVHLHMDGLEQRSLPMPLRFQVFVQALEALHRRTVACEAQPIDVPSVRVALREQGIASDVIDRVAGVLSHAHEPGLRQRLKAYWDQFEAELMTLRPLAERNEFVGRIVATRNHLAHRTDKDSKVPISGITRKQ